MLVLNSYLHLPFMIFMIFMIYYMIYEITKKNKN